MGMGNVVAHVEILSVNKYSHPEDNILIRKDNYKGVSLHRENKWPVIF